MKVTTKFLGLMLAAGMVLASPMMVYADNAAGDADASHHDHDGDWRHGPQDHIISKILNLSDDQVKQLNDIHQKQRDVRKADLEQIKSAREALSAEIVKATPDMNKVNDIQNQIKSLLSQSVDNRLNSILAIKKLLTPEQFAGYMALEKERMLMMHMMNKGHHQFDQKGGFCKLGDGPKHWEGREDKDHDFGDQE